MRLYEFANDDPLRVRLVAILGQLRARVIDKNSSSSMNVDAFLSLLKKLGVTIDPNDLNDMVLEEPLSNLVDSISDGQVYFVGQPSKTGEYKNAGIEKKAMDSEVEKMANRASK